MSGILDNLMPRFDVRERREIRIVATPERVSAACRDADLASGLMGK